VSEEERTLTVDQILVQSGYGVALSDDAQFTIGLENRIFRLILDVDALKSKVNKIAKFLDIEDEL
jgi:hypothetical protein